MKTASAVVYAFGCVGDVCPLVSAACDEDAGLLAAERAPFEPAGNGVQVRWYDWEWSLDKARVMLWAHYDDGSARPVALYDGGELARVQRLVTERNRHLLTAIPYWAHGYVEVLQPAERRRRWERALLETHGFELHAYSPRWWEEEVLAQHEPHLADDRYEV